jgi:hypothetical protein
MALINVSQSLVAKMGVISMSVTYFIVAGYLHLFSTLEADMLISNLHLFARYRSVFNGSDSSTF